MRAGIFTQIYRSVQSDILKLEEAKHGQTD